MGLLVEGKWEANETARFSKDGRYVRTTTSFRDRVTADGSSGFKAEKDRYHLYIANACPWAHRTLLLRNLKGLQDTISLSVVTHRLGPDGWEFDTEPGAPHGDAVNGVNYVRELYVKAKQDYSGRVTVPVLWDKQRGTIVNNESREIVRMLDCEFDEFGDFRTAFLPGGLEEEVDTAIDSFYDPVNNGVYKAGFARTQESYEACVTEVFRELDRWEAVLERQRYLCGDAITEADWCLFPTLVRFDLVYHGHFKCNLRRIQDYPNLWNYLKELYQYPGVAETCNFDHIKRTYYGSQVWVNPTGVVPLGPLVDFDAPHDRATRSYARG